MATTRGSLGSKNMLEFISWERIRRTGLQAWEQYAPSHRDMKGYLGNEVQSISIVPPYTHTHTHTHTYIYITCIL